MDDDRFDRLARTLRAGASRRTLLAALSTIAPAGLADRLAWAKKGHKKHKKGKGKGKHKGKGKAKGAQCRTSQSDDATTTTVTFTQDSLTLTDVDQTPVDPRDVRTSTMTIRQKNALVLETQTTIHPEGPIEVRVTYGNLYQGINEALLTVSGGTVSGSIDGRALVPFPATETPETLQFQDGQPAPESTVDPKLRASITKLLKQATAKQPSCASATGRHARAGQPRAGDDLACLACKAHCVWKELVCTHGVPSACSAVAGVPFLGGVLYGACLVIAYAGCVDEGIDCLDECRSSTDCCPVQCGTLFDLSCCEANERCLTFGTGLGQCCAPGEIPCHEQNCCQSHETCLPDGTCCPSPCGDQCCGGPFTTCCGGQCCTGSCFNGVCCGANQQPCGGSCCGNNCCRDVCCLPGQSCDPVTGRCANRCGPGQRACDSSVPGNPVCCLFDEECCGNGQCCPPNTSCCGSSAGPFCGPPDCVR